MLSYTAQIPICNQWDNAVDFGSPISSWTDTMLDVVSEYGRPIDAKGWTELRCEVRRREAAGYRDPARGLIPQEV